MQKQIYSAGKRGFFSKKTTGIQVRDKFTFEDMLCFQKVISCLDIHVFLSNISL